MAVVPPPAGPPSVGRPGDMPPEDPEDARLDAGLHEGAADGLLALVAPVFEQTATVGDRHGDAVERPLLDDRDAALLRGNVASAEATLALGFRVGQVAAVLDTFGADIGPTLERIAHALERLADRHGASS